MNQNHALQHPSFHWTSFTETFLLFSGRPPDLHWKAKKLDRRFGTHRADRQGYKKPEQIGWDYSAADQIGWDYSAADQIGWDYSAADQIGWDYSAADQIGWITALRTRSAGITVLPTRSAGNTAACSNRSAIGLRHKPTTSARIWKSRAPHMKKNAFYVPEVAQGSHKLNTLGLKNAFYIFLNLFRSQKSRNM